MKRLVPVVAALTAGILLVILWWIWNGRGPASPVASVPADQASATAPSPPVVSARLTLVRDGDTAVGIVRLFDQRARNGFTQSGMSVIVSRAAIETGIAFEVEPGDDGAAAGTRPVAGARPTVIRTPADGAHVLQAETTLEVWANLTALPPAGRVRVSLPVGDATVTTDWVEVLPAPTAAADVLALRARAERLTNDADLSATAEALVAAAPDDARGYYYRGVAAEARGDRAAAIAAYEAALARTPRDGQEPPMGIYRRLARLRAAP